ncbi:hypothetical protein [Streptomyces sp. NPDC001135]
MVAHEVLEHRAVTVGIQDPLDDRVESGVQCVASGHADQTDVGCAGPVALAQHDAGHGVLADQGQIAAEPLAQTGRDGRLPGGAVAAHDDQPRLLGSHHHERHDTDRH